MALNCMKTLRHTGCSHLRRKLNRPRLRDQASGVVRAALVSWTARITCSLIP